jgi:hypothetical protein
MYLASWRLTSGGRLQKLRRSLVLIVQHLCAMKLPHYSLVICVCLLLLCTLPAAVQAQDYTYTTNNGTIVITKYIGSGGAVTIPGTITGLPVTSIGNGAFAHLAIVFSVTIPDSVTNIGDHAFDSNTSLASVTIPDSVTNIGNFAFASCTSLTSITIPDSVNNIGNFAFTSCTSLTTVTIGNSVATIGNFAFAFCTGLTSVTIANSVINIGSQAFASCISLTGIHFHGNAPGLGERVFKGADNAIIYYLPGTTGWGTKFGGRPTAPWKP